MASLQLIGAEFLVNTTTAGLVVEPQITALAEGRFVVTWTSFNENQSGNGDIRGRVFGADGTAAGSDFLVNTTTAGDQVGPAITALASGGFVATWTDWNESGDGDIRGRVFGADGSPAGADFLVNITTAGDQASPQITALPEGGFVVTWQSSEHGSTFPTVLLGRMFAGDGTPAGSDFLVNTTTAELEGSQIKALPGGGFVVTWSSDEDGNVMSLNADIRGRVFALDGTPAGSDFLVNTTTASFEGDFEITPLAGGGFVEAWESWDQGGAHLRARVFADDGSPAGNDFLVASNATGDLSWHHIAALAGGGFVVTWRSDPDGEDNSTSSGDIRGRLFTPNGTPAGNDFLVNSTTAGEEHMSHITALTDGSFVVTWASGDNPNTAPDIRGRLFAADGTPAGDDFLVNTTTAGNQYWPLVTALADGHLAATWLSYDLGTFRQDIRGAVFSVQPGNQLPTIPTELADTIDGTGGDDTFDALGGDDTVRGGDGNDTLIGGAGADGLDGGAGTDTASYAGSDSAVTVNLVTSAGSGGHAAGDTFTGIENLIGSAHADSLTGNAGINVLNGGVGNDTLAGGGGNDGLFGDDANDTLHGGAGADVLNGGAGIDVASYGGSSAGVSVNLAATGPGSGGHAAGDTFTAIENLIGSAHADSLTGNAFNNVLNGGLGNDTLTGSEGNDSLIGGVGADALTGGAGIDAASYAGSDAAVTVNLAATGLASGGHAAGDTFTGIETLIGSAHADSLTGNAFNNVLSGGLGNDTLAGGGGNDTVVGGDGNDTLHGGAGADALNGGAGIDVASYGGSTAGVTVNLAATGPASGGHAAGDAFTGIENLIGSAHADKLTGNASSNVLNGGLGNDTLAGGAGNDRLTGGDGNDVLHGGAGADVLNGGAGIDVASYGGSSAGVSVNLAATGPASGGHAAGDTFTGIENLIGSAHADTLAGNANNNVLNGGLGSDALTGGAGLDAFVFNTSLGASNIDQITDLSVVDDTIRLENAVFTALTSTGVLSEAAFHAGTVAGDTDDRIVYDSTSGALSYDADGAGGVAQVQFATLATHPGGVTNADFLVI